VGLYLYLVAEVLDYLITQSKEQSPRGNTRRRQHYSLGDNLKVSKFQQPE